MYMAWKSLHVYNVPLMDQYTSHMCHGDTKTDGCHYFCSSLICYWGVIKGTSWSLVCQRCWRRMIVLGWYGMYAKYWGSWWSLGVRGPILGMNPGSVEDRPAIKLSLKVWMGLSAAFRRWIWGGGNMVRYLSVKYGLLEDTTSFIIHDLEVGLVSSICECVYNVLDPFIDACSWSGWYGFC